MAGRITPTAPAVNTSFFAEGASGDFFETRIALTNPGPDPARVTLRFMPARGQAQSAFLEIPPAQSMAVDAAVVLPPASEFATVVESDVPLAAHRLMSWPRPAWRPTYGFGEGYGSHGDRGVPAAATTWYLAEGATHSGFDLFYLLMNPGDADARVRVRYLRPSGAPLEKTYTVGATSRLNIWVNLEEFPDGSGQRLLASSDVSASIESLDAVPIDQ